MTILHDNLYTKRAVATCRGRNRYLSRAMSVKWVPPWPKERRPRKKHETMKKPPNSTTCWGTLLATLGLLSNQLKKHHPNPNRPLHHPARPAHRVVLPQALRPVHPLAPRAAPRPAPRPDHPPVHPPVRLPAHRAVRHQALQAVRPQALQAAPLPAPQPSLWRR